MAKPDTENEASAAPGVAARSALRVVDACLNVLQRWHDRLAGTSERAGRLGHPPARSEPADASAPPARPSLLRRLLVAVILLLAGGAAGAWLAYRGLSHQLAEHAGVVERLQEELDGARKEDARNVKLLDKFQRENAEYRHEAREAQREADKAGDRTAELEAQLEEMKQEQAKHAEQAAQQARRAAAAPRAKPGTPAQKSGKCAAGSAGELTECIEKFNR
ncbi:MAG: hypothetical protein HZA64_15500 [Rhodocyclales bacterium]|nr:hypothetical protein [Rhodocyclales bacterium]